MGAGAFPRIQDTVGLGNDQSGCRSTPLALPNCWTYHNIGLQKNAKPIPTSLPHLRRRSAIPYSFACDFTGLSVTTTVLRRSDDPEHLGHISSIFDEDTQVSADRGRKGCMVRKQSAARTLSCLSEGNEGACSTTCKLMTARSTREGYTPI
jgi:hypothetical protein